ncbi:MAG: lysine exporter LysO family protein [Desulfovibrionaceae bacterium]
MITSLKICTMFILGILCGQAGLFNTEIIKPILSGIVTIILLCGGISIGASKEIGEGIRYYGLKTVYFPIITACTTLIFSACTIPFIIDMPLLEILAISSGFSYYSLSSAIVGELFSFNLGTLILLTNMLLEVWSMLFSWVFARYFGPLGPIAAAGVSSMDLCLPFIIKASGEKYIIIAVINGIVTSILSPLFIYGLYYISTI